MDSFPYEEGTSLMKEFQKSNPDVTGITYINIPAAQKVARVVQEGTMGRTTTDLILASLAPLNKYRELGIVKGSAVSVSSIITVIAYNTEKVNESELPKTMEDLTDPKWFGRIGVWARMADVSGLVSAWGEDKVISYVEKLAKLKPMSFKNHTAMNAALSSGEIDIGISSLQYAPKIIEKGAPVKFIVLEPIIVVQTYAAVTLGDNPNEAKRFIEWLSSSEGAIALERITNRGNINVPETKTAKLIKDKIVSLDSTANLGLETTLSRIIHGR